MVSQENVPNHARFRKQEYQLTNLYTYIMLPFQWKNLVNRLFSVETEPHLKHIQAITE